MVFSSLIFLYFFLPACLIAYFIVKPIWAKNIVLVVFSLFFYSWGEPSRILILLASALINYLVGINIKQNKSEKVQKRCLIEGLIFNIAIIVIFKYTGFIMNNINAIFGLDTPVPEIVQLLGISFYTFQVISYIVDCYWGKIEVQTNFFKLLLYVFLFPQLIAGPIVRYETIAKEIDHRKTTIEDVSSGLTRFVIGLSKKVLIADQLFRVVDKVMGPKVVLDEMTVMGMWYGVILYSLYIYFDFSGYSDIAIGIGRMFGFHFNENFDHPYLCKDITEFWQRWHISLGSWFRDYLLPITFFGRRNKYLSLFFVWLFTGIWHGANWNYIIWGLYYGLFIMLETLVGKKSMNKIPIVLRHIYSKIVIIVGFGIFYFEDFGKLGTFLKNITPFNANGFLMNEIETMSLCNNLFLILIAVICTFPLFRLTRFISNSSDTARTAVSVSMSVVCACLLVLSSIFLVDATTEAFLYWRF